MSACSFSLFFQLNYLLFINLFLIDLSISLLFFQEMWPKKNRVQSLSLRFTCAKLPNLINHNTLNPNLFVYVCVCVCVFLLPPCGWFNGCELMGLGFRCTGSLLLGWWASDRKDDLITLIFLCYLMNGWTWGGRKLRCNFWS